MESELETLSARIRKLEHENRRMKLVGAGTLVVLVALVSMGLAPGKPRTIEAEKIVIRDSHGRARLMIGTPEAAGAAVDLRPDSPAIWLSDERGSDRAMLTSDGLYLANDREKPLAEFSSGPDRPSLRFFGPDGKLSWSAP